MNTNELFHLLALSQVDGVGDIVAKKLISHCGSAENVFKSKLKALKAIDGVGEVLVKNLKDKFVFEKAEKELHYVKRFTCEVTQDKRVSYISEAPGSYLDVVSTAFRPEARIVFNKLLKETKNLPDQVLNLADLIDVKGMKAQGNQMTKMKVKEIVLTHPIDESPEPWPVEEALEIEDQQAEDEAEPASMEWDLSKKEDDNPDQIPLFIEDPEVE